MPHGLTFDRHGNIWVTDVALHQAMKFHPDVDEPTITIGTRFSPGSSPNHLCQPTAVAVASSGEVCSSWSYNQCGECNLIIMPYSNRCSYQMVTATIVFWNLTQPADFCELFPSHRVRRILYIYTTLSFFVIRVIKISCWKYLLILFMSNSNWSRHAMCSLLSFKYIHCFGCFNIVYLYLHRLNKCWNNIIGNILRFYYIITEFMSLQVPHGLALLEHLDLLCVADRENMRVVCPR